MRKVMYCLTSAMVVVMLTGFSIGIAQAGKCELPAFDANNFMDQNDNPYFPMDIGSVYVYEAETDDAFIRDFIYISPDFENFVGLDWTVVYDVEYEWVENPNTGTRYWRISESTEDYHQWDGAGNFWYGGEDTVAYLYPDDWAPGDPPPPTSTEGTWKANLVDVFPGIILLADPHPGDCVQQENAPDVAQDRGKVLRLNATVSIDDTEYLNCEETKEWSLQAPGDIEHKYYAPEVGLVYIEELKEKTVIFELVEIGAYPTIDPFSLPTDIPSP